MKIVDSHCHLCDERYTDVGAEVARYEEGGVLAAINAAYSVASSFYGKELAERYPSVFFTAGIHPDNPLSATDENLESLLTLSAHPKCVAIGEIGLDYHYLPYDEGAQKTAFHKQIQLAKTARLPFAVHMREATEDTLTVLKERRADYDTFLMHCYSGSVETAKILLDMGAYFSFSGTLTFKNAKNLREVAAYLPADRILVETDSPYLAPEPFRGQENKPLFVKHVLSRLAEIRGESVEQSAEQTYQNLKRLFPKFSL